MSFHQLDIKAARALNVALGMVDGKSAPLFSHTIFTSPGSSFNLEASSLRNFLGLFEFILTRSHQGLRFSNTSFQNS